MPLPLPYCCREESSDPDDVDSMESDDSHSDFFSRYGITVASGPATLNPTIPGPSTILSQSKPALPKAVTPHSAIIGPSRAKSATPLPAISSTSQAQSATPRAAIRVQGIPQSQLTTPRAVTPNPVKIKVARFRSGNPSPQPVTTNPAMPPPTVNILPSTSMEATTQSCSRTTHSATPPARLEWSEGNDFEPEIHPFDDSTSGVTSVFPVENDGANIRVF
ncbi:hypothetical protein Pmani_023442 [Petrolisthes manimaculis]|uniref:Uncharacterized protein n=1 Tax=Petrolisthes manimaculis TaxID=1843537 RepID=A0AAE1PAY9_9EUCA|nr:hypothetical protein Pmani_023442 [Petrolisthes manimaculis]